MDEATIIEVLKRWNAWERTIDSGIKREDYINKIYPYFDRKEIIVLKGVRRSGKSTIVKQLMLELIKRGIDKNQMLYLNLEDYNFANELNPALFEEVLVAFKKYSKCRKRIYFFIDEIQKIEGWEKWVRTKYDLGENIKFIITGSSASLLSRELSTLLTGRNLSFRIMPLSFSEFSRFSRTKSLEEYMRFGGFPEVVLEKDEQKKLFLLEQYFSDILHKDVIDRYKVRNAKDIIAIARYILSTAGSKVSISKLSRVFGLTNDTISQYLSYMIDAFLLFEVSFFSYSAKVRHDRSKLPKLYSIDNGLINAVTVKYSRDVGRMFENTVFIKLLDDYEEISYWSDADSGVDFIAGKIAVNVTSADSIPEREFKGLEAFKKRHHGFSLMIVAASKSREVTITINDFLLIKKPAAG